MSRKLVECVPNYSEGRRERVMDAIVAPFRDRPGVHLLDHRADPDHNRLVVSLVGEPEPIQESLLESARTAVDAIDLRVHTGAHPRIGAVDVIPFVPVRGITMDECVSLARGFAERYARATGVPVYLYEHAALRPERRKLENVRRGQFEALVREIANPERTPDFGAPVIHPSAGATAIGARPFLIAFNINLQSSDINAARDIARAIRASGGGLSHVKAMGIELAERGMVQVSINVTEYRVNPLHEVLERARAEASRRGILVAETEIYGLVPAEALVATAEHALQLAGFNASQVLDLRLLDLMEKA
ncbi:MAG: glutamate formimidoyltransferase [Spirochaetia bacterium]|jgi:glutamate formiminotransferase